ncbi:MAG: hypothetical protein ACOYI4_05040, partial [Christensenellales bacterium]
MAGRRGVCRVFMAYGRGPALGLATRLLLQALTDRKPIDTIGTESPCDIDQCLRGIGGGMG